MTSLNEVPTQASPGAQDDTTRYLCAAAHLDSDYADEAIREFLLEPTRAIPPSPGVNAHSVLSEALAARTRRRIRDCVLVVLMAVFIGFSLISPLLIVWFVAGVLVSMLSMGGRQRFAGPVPQTLLVALGILVVPTIGYLLFNTDVFGGGELGAEGIGSGAFGGSGFESGGFDGYEYGEASSGSPFDNIIACLSFGLTLVVLLLDRRRVWHLVTGTFGRSAKGRHSGFRNGESPFLSRSPATLVDQLYRYQEDSDADEDAEAAPLVVYRGFDPFVGAGTVRQPWSVAVPLRRLPDDELPGDSSRAEFTTAELYRRVGESMDALTDSEGLSPGARFRRMITSQTVLADSAELIDNRDDPAVRNYLPDGIGYPPVAGVPAEELDTVRSRPREWARYYLCFRVETWDRDLVLSTYLHAAVDDSTLYLEWTPCVLGPIRTEFSKIDKLSDGGFRPVADALLDWVKLPATILGRLIHTVRPIKPDTNAPGVVNPDSFGSLQSLREMAASARTRNYFQMTDVERYIKIMESRVMPAVAELMKDCGYSSAEFEQQVSTVVHNSVSIAGANDGPVNVGGSVGGSMNGPSQRQGGSR